MATPILNTDSILSVTAATPNEVNPHTSPILDCLSAMQITTLLTPGAVRTVLHLKPSTIEILSLAGRGPRPTYVGRKTFYRVLDICDWLNESQRTLQLGSTEDTLAALRGLTIRRRDA